MADADDSIVQKAADALKHDGAKNQFDGTMKQVGGTLTGNDDTVREGSLQKKIGDAERTIGGKLDEEV